MATVNELVTALGFELKPDAVKNINKIEVGISHLQDAIGKLGKSLTDGLSMKDYFAGALGRSQDIMNSARAIGMSTDALQEWQYAAKASGVSAQSVISDIENLRANFFMSEKGMLRLADSFKKMSAGSAYWYGNMYGLSKDTVLMLRQGSAALKQMQDEAHRIGAITPQEELERAAKLNADLEKRKIALQKIVDTIVLKVTPAITKVFDRFDAWLAADPGRAELLIQGITGALIGLASSEVLSGIGTLVNLVKSLMIGITAMGPYAAVLTGVGAAVYGLYKDFQNFQEQGESIMPWNKILQGAESAKEIFQNLKKIFDDLWESVKRFADEFPALGNVFNSIGETIEGSLDAAWRMIQSIMGSFGVMIDWIANDRTWDGLKDRFGALYEGTWEGFGKNTSENSISSVPVIDNSPGKVLASEVGLKPSTIKGLSEVLREATTTPMPAAAPTVRDANFNGANINIITGASSEEIVDVLTSLGGNVSESYSGLGYMY